MVKKITFGLLVSFIMVGLMFSAAKAAGPETVATFEGHVEVGGDLWTGGNFQLDGWVLGAKDNEFGLRAISGVSGIYGKGPVSGVVGSGESSGVYGFSPGGYGVWGTSGGTGTGVYGTGRKYGVEGYTALGDAAIYGSIPYGYGLPVTYNTNTNPAIYGKNASPAAGDNPGVKGESTAGYGVYGTSTNKVGVYGNGFTAGGSFESTSGYGVYGTSNTGIGVYGSTIAAGNSGSPFKVKQGNGFFTILESGTMILEAIPADWNVYFIGMMRQTGTSWIPVRSTDYGIDSSRNLWVIIPSLEGNTEVRWIIFYN